MVKTILSLLASLFRFGADRQEHANTPQMKANAAAKQESEQKTTMADAVAKRDVNAVRKELAE